MTEYIIIEREWTETLQGAELLLYAYIKMTCDNCGGACECSRANLSYWTGVGERWLNKSLKRLQERGLISIEPVAGKYNNYIAHPYTLSVPLHLKCTPTLKVGGTPTLKVYPPDIIIDNNIFKIKEKIKKDAPAPARELDFVAPEYKEVFDLWLQYKKERRETYKSERSMKAAYNRLLRLADNNAETAAAIVEQSIANNWAGLFELKESKKNGNISRQQEYSDAVNRAIVAGLFAQ